MTTQLPVNTQLHTLSQPMSAQWINCHSQWLHNLKKNISKWLHNDIHCYSQWLQNDIHSNNQRLHNYIHSNSQWLQNDIHFHSQWMHNEITAIANDYTMIYIVKANE
jgi:hypothetical protein